MREIRTPGSVRGRRATGVPTLIAEKAKQVGSPFAMKVPVVPNHREIKVGTMVEILAGGVYEIDSLDNDGPTHAILALKAKQLISILHCGNSENLVVSRCFGFAPVLSPMVRGGWCHHLVRFPLP